MILKSETYHFHRLDLTRQAGFIATVKKRIGPTVVMAVTANRFRMAYKAARPSRITSAHHQTFFRPPFMTASAPPLAFMIVNSGPRWLPEPEPSAQVGAGVPPKGAAGHQPQSFGG